MRLFILRSLQLFYLIFGGDLIEMIFALKISLQEKYWNQTKDLATAGFETVQIEKNATAKEVSIENKSNGERSFTIAFMVDDGKGNQNTNKNNYVKYYIMDQDGIVVMSEI